MKVSVGVRFAFASLDCGSSLALPSPRDTQSDPASLDCGSSLALPSPHPRPASARAIMCESDLIPHAERGMVAG